MYLLCVYVHILHVYVCLIAVITFAPFHCEVLEGGTTF